MVTDLTKGSPARVILLYSLPIILGNVFQQVYNLVDTAIVGRFVSYQALAGVGITNGMTFFVLGFVLGVTSGLGICTAQYFGAGDKAGVKRSIAASIEICVAMGIVLTLATVLLCGPLLRLIGTGPEIFGYAYDYLLLIFAGLFANVAYNLIACILRALGDSRTPLVFLIFSSVLNVGLDLLLVASLGWGVKGAAAATIASQLLSAVLCFAYSFRRFPEMKLSREDFRVGWGFIWEHLRLALPMAFQFSITAIGIVLLQAALNAFPPAWIAGFTAANKVQNIGALVSISFGVAIANYVGQNYGAGDMLRVRRGVNVTLLMTMAVCIVSSTLMVVFAEPVTSLFVADGAGAMGAGLGDAAGAAGAAGGASSAIADLFEASREYLVISAIFFPFLFVIFIYRNALQGVGRPFWPLMAGVLELLIRAVAAATLPQRFGYNGIVLIDVLAWVGAAVLLAICYYSWLRRCRAA
ncbi:MAG: MATE family efflux transporter [Bacteroidales bacterium]|nr:MATE family efflux transporter [Candidatus Cryptobacteroides aphodequi]